MYDNEYEEVEEGVVLGGFAILTVLAGFVSFYKGNKEKKSIDSLDRDVLCHFTNIPTSKLESTIKDIVKKYPIINIDQNVYKQFMSFKHDCSIRIDQAHSIMNKEHINLNVICDYESILKSFKIPYVVDHGEVSNLSEVQKLNKDVGRIENKYKLSEDTLKKYSIDTSDIIYDTPSIPNSLKLPSFEKSGKLIQVKSSDILTDFLSHDILAELNDALSYFNNWNMMYSRETDDGFVKTLEDSVREINPQSKQNSLIDGHPFFKVLGVLSQKPVLVDAILIRPLSCYCNGISTISKYIKLPSKVQESTSIYEMAKNYNKTSKLY